MIKLKAWEPHPHSAFKVYADLQKSVDSLEVSYLVLGPVGKLLLLPPKVLPLRKNELWQETCFELFIGPSNSQTESYFELNFASTGNWNFYSLSGYRKDLQEVESAAPKMFHHEIQKDSFLVKFVVEYPFDLKKSFAPTVILKSQDQQKSYWAPSTPGTQPDFHLPEIRQY